MVVNCPFCKEKSYPSKGKFSLCNHIIACFSKDDIESYHIKRRYHFITNQIAELLIMEGLLFKVLQDYGQAYLKLGVDPDV